MARLSALIALLALTAPAPAIRADQAVSLQQAPASPGITGTPQGMAVLAAEDSRAPTPQDIAVLIQSAGSQDPEIQTAAIRALGRLERRDVVTDLLRYLRATSTATRTEAAFAIGQAMRGERMPLDPNNTQVDGVQLALMAAAKEEKKAIVLAEIARAVSRLPYERAEQVAHADALLTEILTLSKDLSLERKQRGDAQPALVGATDGVEMLGRFHAKLSAASDNLIDALRRHITDRIAQVPTADRPPRHRALQALIAVRGLDEDTLLEALKEVDNSQARRVAVAALGAGGSPIAGEDQRTLLREALNDRSPAVRYEAVRGYARTQAKTEGCQPLTDALIDKNTHVALAAIDALGDMCAGDENAVNRLIAEARTPAAQGNHWQRESHALVALAKLSPLNSEVPLVSHSRHSVWQVRMYAARAAGILNDVATLERLATDDHDNVRDATLAPLRRIKKEDAEPHFVAALGRRDYQLVRTAAKEMQGLPVTKPLSVALLEALKRVTLDSKETSRDTRIALLERLQEFGNSDMEEALVPLLKDGDVRIGQAAVATLSALTGKTFSADPQPTLRQPLPTFNELVYYMEYNPVLVMETGGEIELEIALNAAPMAAVRFMRLAKQNYFEGLTFHRVVPNFIVQGGSPGANEYVGDGPFMRDEIRMPHVAGTVGISTRGRDTGDAQLFINLVDNQRLDYEYTVFARLAVRSASLARAHAIVEGDVIKEVKFLRRRKLSITK